MDDAYATFIDEVQAGGFGAPADDRWSAELIAAHVARNHEALIAATEAVLAEDPTSYDNHEHARADLLAAYADSYGGLRGLADRIAVTAITLRELAALLEERGLGLVEVPVRIEDGGETVVDQPMPWAKLLEIDATVHVPRHLAQLRALRPS